MRHWRGGAVDWRIARSHQDHMRRLPVQETGLVQLGRGPAEFKTRRVTGRNSIIMRFHILQMATGYTVPSRDWISLMLPLSWQGDYIINGRETKVGDAILTTGKNGYIMSGQDRDVVALALRTSILKRTVAALSGRPDDRIPIFDSAWELGEAGGTVLRREILSIFQQAKSAETLDTAFAIGPVQETRLFETVARTLIRLQGLESVSALTMESDFDLAVRARKLAEGNPVGLTMTDLCAELGVGQTRLHQSFVSAHGMPPAKFLRHLRLTRVQEWLCNTDTPPRSVKDAALYYGFLHGGRFSVEYKKLFGESPSSTLDRTFRLRFEEPGLPRRGDAANQYAAG